MVNLKQEKESLSHYRLLAKWGQKNLRNGKISLGKTVNTLEADKLKKGECAESCHMALGRGKKKKNSVKV